MAVTTVARNRAVVFGIILLTLIAAGAIWPEVLAPHDPFEQHAANRLQPAGSSYLMGRDTFGRDVFARVLFAGRVSLLVAVGAVTLGGLMGSVLGLVAGFSGRHLGSVIMRVVDLLMAFPSLLLGLVILAVLGPGLDRMIVALGVLVSGPFARVLHAATLRLKQEEFVLAARAVGAGSAAVLLRHVLPNAIDEIVVMACLWAATAIRVEAGLSFIGLGVPPPTPTWGNMIREGLPFLDTATWVSVGPGLAIFLTVLAFNLMSDGLRDALDPRSRT